MSTDETRPADEARKQPRIDFDRHATAYRTDFEAIAGELHAKCPIAWTDNHQGYWVASGNTEVFALARRADVLSNDNDVEGTKNGYFGITIPAPERNEYSRRGGFLEMDPPEQRHYRQALNAYLSPAAVARWKPVIDEITRACLDEKIESGSIDFVDDLANIVPAVLTMALLGMPLKDWVVFCEPAHASVYTPPDSPDREKVMQGLMESYLLIAEYVGKIKENPRPGLINALINADINGAKPTDLEVVDIGMLLIGGGFDTTTALTAHSLEWLSENPGERARLSRERDTLLDSATEEFLRTPQRFDVVGAVRVVVLTAAGERTFCAGMDLKAWAAGKVKHIPGPGIDIFIKRTFPKPLIGAVNGTAVGGGFELALACDLLVVSETAKFGLPEVSRGQIPSRGGTRLPRRVPLPLALELGLTGDLVTAARLREMGLVNHVVPASEVRKTALELAERIAANGPWRCGRPSGS